MNKEREGEASKRPLPIWPIKGQSGSLSPIHILFAWNFNFKDLLELLEVKWKLLEQKKQ